MENNPHEKVARLGLLGASCLLGDDPGSLSNFQSVSGHCRVYRALISYYYSVLPVMSIAVTTTDQ
jgi:hypothetical protein